MKRGIYCAGGSDAPVEDCDPLMGLYDAMYRLPHSFKQSSSSSAAAAWTEDDVFLPHERLSFSEALWLYTIGAAYACYQEAHLGELEVGYLGDFIVLDRDVSSKPQELLEASVVEVWVNGVARKKEEEKGQQQMKLDGPFIPGKGGDIQATMEICRKRHEAILKGKREGGRCCGH